MIHPEPAVTAYLTHLSDLLGQSHSPAGLIQLAFNLQVDHEDVPATELVTHLFQRRRLPELLANLNRTYPATTWPPIPEIVELVTLSPADRFQRAAQLDHVPEPAAVPAHSRLPLSRNPFFTGRLPNLQALHDAIFGETRKNQRQTLSAGMESLILGSQLPPVKPFEAAESLL